MSKGDFRRQLNSVFDEISGSPSPNLRARVRSSIAQAPEQRAPYWIAAVAACLIAAVLVAVLFVSNPLNRRSNVGPGPAPTATPSQEPTGPPFVCSSSSLGGVTPPGPPHNVPISRIDVVRGNGYDRITITFGGAPEVSVDFRPQSDTTFTLSPSGQPATLQGRKGLLIVVHSADLHSAYSGSADIVTSTQTVLEVRRVEDFEGVVQLGVGINGTGCYRASWLANPDRLVVDVQSGP